MTVVGDPVVDSDALRALADEMRQKMPANPRAYLVQWTMECAGVKRGFREYVENRERALWLLSYHWRLFLVDRTIEKTCLATVSFELTEQSSGGQCDYLSMRITTWFADMAAQLKQLR